MKFHWRLNGMQFVYVQCTNINLCNWLLQNIFRIDNIWISLDFRLLKKKNNNNYGPVSEMGLHIVSHCAMFIRSTLNRIWHCVAPSTSYRNQNTIALADELDSIVNEYHALFTNGDSVRLHNIYVLYIARAPAIKCFCRLTAFLNDA